MVQPLHIKNAFVWDGFSTERRDLYTSSDGRIVDKAANGAHVIDLDGYSIFPGLINAHDHLELNHYPRSKFRERYDNAHQWGEDMNVRLDTEPYKSLRAYPLEDKLFIGGLKNLLCGATTVAHHGPPHKPMFHKDFPVRVLREYGWAHSLHFDTDEEVVRSYQRTPKNWPWFIHLAEGTDEVAAGEYQRLKVLGCLNLNTVIVHGVGLTSKDAIDSHHLAGEFEGSHGSQMPVIWCPTTNVYLLGKTGHSRMGWNTHNILGSDSRLTADGDLLDEMRFAYETYKAQGDYVAVHLVTTPHFRWHSILKDRLIKLRTEDCGDFVIINNSENPAYSLCHSKRKDLALVIRDGIPQIGDPDMMAKFLHVETVPAILDGRPKAIHRKLAQRIWKCTLKEVGLEVDEPLRRKYLIF